MIERTQIGGEPRRDGLDRRQVLGGGALLLAGVSPNPAARAQVPPGVSSQPPPQTPPDALGLTANMLTRMAAPVRVNGQRSLMFVLDTGAERTAIASDLVEHLRLEPGPTVMVHGVTSAQPTPTVRISRLVFGYRRFNDMVVPVFDRTLMGADGLLGLDVMSEFRLSLDMVRRRVSLGASGPGFISTGPSSIIPSRLPGGARARAGASGQLILTNAYADGVPTQSFIDSGGQYSIGNTILLEAIGGRIAGPPIQLLGVTGQTINAHAAQVRDLKIGRYDLGPTPLLFADLHAFHTLGLGEAPALLIGADILYRFRRVELDYGSRRIGLSGLLPGLASQAAR